ncbi:hypothetical protein [Pseudomonas citronellolis]|uniref:hypothetical protein n=1 Tax=Pseudomonas citronellolis TaxID=53408 RepID=UPI0020A1DAAF|nr:hypothetical protein [Pseudomonas citronellolis]MCP1606031.1 hypothetical protein [Pseudomonas citronellolis]MCP1656559.1 hypothetical protein [Pseudomonas citronellolis]MCP1723588.1 hypothetical protein [Pseudomonas citronellolis]
MPINKQVEDLLSEVQGFTSKEGTRVVTDVEMRSRLFLEWIPYLNNAKTGTADDLLDGAVSSLREMAACAGLGLVRPALLAMRTQIDLILSWLYFKDHRVEWDYVNSTGDGFKLKKEILEYLVRYYSSFGRKFGILKGIIIRKEVDPYRLLSAHIHSQSSNTLPLVDDLKDVVGKVTVINEIPMLAHEVDEYLSDILFSVFGDGWTQISPSLIKSLDMRFKSKAQKQDFYATK